MNSSRHLLFGVHFSPHQRNIISIQTSEETNHEIKTDGYTFSLVFDIDVKNPYQQFLIFLMNTFSEAAVRICSSKYKIGALKNFAIFRIKKTLQPRRFPVNIAKFFKNSFFIECLRWLVLHLF